MVNDISPVWWLQGAEDRQRFFPPPLLQIAEYFVCVWKGKGHTHTQPGVQRVGGTLASLTGSPEGLTADLKEEKLLPGGSLRVTVRGGVEG